MRQTNLAAMPTTPAAPADPWPGGARLSEPFLSYLPVPVKGGILTVAQAGPPPAAGATPVLALHGMTGTHMVYRTIARELAAASPPLCLLAPDMRGRGRSAHLPGPYGMAAHVDDLVAVLDHAGVERAIVAGHSMGSNIAARFADDHPERVAAVVLLDSGVPIVADELADAPAEEDADEPPGMFDRFDRRFESVEEYLAYWRGHPALQHTWDDDVEAFVRRDFVEDDDGVRAVAKVTAVLTDVRDLMVDGRTWSSVTRLRMPTLLLRAERGMYDDAPLIPQPDLEEFLAEHPHVAVDMMADVNHFTLVLGQGDGPRHVATRLLELARAT